MSERTLADLKQKQALPLKVKISLTRERIRQWVNEFGEDGVYVSFSGGKDSTVLLDIVRNVCGYTDVPAVFVDVPTQYPELKEFVMRFNNVVILRPKISFVDVCKKYGFPLISKEVSEVVFGARKYLKKCLTKDSRSESILQTDRQTDRQTYEYWYNRLTGQGEYSKFSISPLRKTAIDLLRGGTYNQRTAMLYNARNTNATVNADALRRYDSSGKPLSSELQSGDADGCLQNGLGQEQEAEGYP